jgi:hypothetical protein
LDLISEDQYFEVINSLPAGNEKLDDDRSQKVCCKDWRRCSKRNIKKDDIETLSRTSGIN